MARYTTLSPAHIEELLAQYGLRPLTARPLAGGAANSSYLVDSDSAPHVLTVLDNHDTQSAEQLAALLEHLVRHHVPTSRPLVTSKGERLTQISGRPVLFKEYIAGRCLPELSADQCRTAGALLAKIHSVQPPAWLPSNARRLPADWLTEAGDFADRKFVDWMTNQWEEARDVESLRGPWGLVHGDYFPDNIVVTSTGDLAILDWETATHDLLVLDIGMAIVGLCRTDGCFHADRAVELLRGYESGRTLTDGEKAQLANAARYASIVIAYHRYRRHHLTHPDPTKQHLYQEIPRFVQSLDNGWPAAHAATSSSTQSPGPATGRIRADRPRTGPEDLARWTTAG